MKKLAKQKRQRLNRKLKTNSRKVSRPDFSGLVETSIRNPMSEHDLTQVLSALIVIADDYLPEIPFPYDNHGSSYMGEHKFEREVMMFFPGVTTKQEHPIFKTQELSGTHYVLCAFPDTTSPIGERGLMYVCRAFIKEPDFGEIMQLMLDSTGGTWIVRG